ncbi:MAG: helix-turn-helix transcriptional regulator [Mailhella sp.]|nr:helix-turn-helix transcriptional regulator [Mailhella sp.]
MEQHDIHDFLHNPSLTILQLCNDRGLSQEKLAALAKVSYSQVSKIINQGADPKLSTVKKIAMAFDLLRKPR